MHAAARSFVQQQIGGKHYGRVIEIGGRDINGGVTDLFTCDRYTSIDLEPGPGVDVVADATTYEPDYRADLVICCEVLEHAPDQRGVVEAALSWLAPGGVLVVTAGGPGRAPHSGHDGGPPHEGEHYGNLDPDDLNRWLLGCEQVHVVYAPGVCDVYGVAVQPGPGVLATATPVSLVLTEGQAAQLAERDRADLTEQARAGRNGQGVTA